MRLNRYYCTLSIIMLILGGILSARNIKNEEKEFPIFEGPYLAQKPPGMKPEIFSPGIISAGKHDGLYISITSETELNHGEANIWYLLHSGFAVNTHTKLLIFDYIPVYSEEKSIPVNPSLEKGFINSEEIENLDVYVFVSHEHGDHFNNVIFDWERKIKNITYFFGWQAGESKKDNYNYMIGPRAEKKINGMEVFTINSFHARVPEVAFLIKVDGLVVYFSGDYRGDYKNDNEFLKSKVNRVDIAFMNIDHYGDDLKPNEADFIEKLMPRIVFPMHYGNDEDVLKGNADKVKKAGYRTKLICVEKRGDQFFFDNLKDLIALTIKGEKPR